MELSSVIQDKLKNLVTSWFTPGSEMELEATFGLRGTIQEDAFLRIAKRLHSKKYQSISQLERLSVCLQNHLRFTMEEVGNIQQYCMTEKVFGIPYTVIYKDRVEGVDGNVDIEDYNVRVKSRREQELDKNDRRVLETLAKWNNIPKAFRLIRRWTFEKGGVKFDLSMVRSTDRNTAGEFKWVRNFKDKDITKKNPSYEVEVELKRDAFKTPEDAYKALLQGIGEILRGIQNNSYLIRNSVKSKVLDGYKKLTGTEDFRGASTLTLKLEHVGPLIKGVEKQRGKIRNENIRYDYNVTDKADGLRALGYVDNNGELYLIDMAMNVIRTGLRKEKLRNSLVDGEWITEDHQGNFVNMYLIFDVFYGAQEKFVGNKPFHSNPPKDDDRYEVMQAWIQTWNSEGGPEKKIQSSNFEIGAKTFQFGNAVDETAIFTGASLILDTKKPYHTDGLIFTSNSSPLPHYPRGTFYQQFKWKPPHDNTIDFLMTFEKDPENKTKDRIVSNYDEGSQTYSQYKVGRLFVGSSLHEGFVNPRNAILYQLQLPAQLEDDGSKKDAPYKPVLFNPIKYSSATSSVCYLPVEEDLETGEMYAKTVKTQEAIRDKSIVEMMFDITKEPGHQWIPRNIRADKTSRFQRGELNRTLNSDKTANDIWTSIHEPVTEYMIRTGSDRPSEEEQTEDLQEKPIVRKYFEPKLNNSEFQKTKAMRDFHNLVVKEMLYSAFFGAQGGSAKKLMDMAVGQGGDIGRYLRYGADFVLGIDVSEQDIINPNDGAYRRYVNNIIQYGRDAVTPMVFVVGDSTKPIMDGSAGADNENRDILRTLFGSLPSESPPMPYVQLYQNKFQKGVDGISCMFALHYFFETKDKFEGFLKNLDETLKVGGYFFGANFDGESVFNKLQSVKQGDGVSGSDTNTVLWSIKKLYDYDSYPSTDEEMFGIPIDVFVSSIGKFHREYLVSFRYLVERLKQIGIELLSKEEMKAMKFKKLNTSTALFEYNYKGNEEKYVMSDIQKEFSFLNRWYMFRRVRKAGVENMYPMDMPAVAPVEAEMPTQAVAPGLRYEDEEEKIAFEPVSAAATVAPVERVVPGAAVFEDAPNLPPITQKFEKAQIYPFKEDAPLSDSLKIGLKGAARWLCPSAPFAIPDPGNSTILYPSILHFYNGMKMKYASNQPGLAQSIFSINGLIHQEFAKIKASKEADKKYSEDEMFKLMEDEYKKVKNTNRNNWSKERKVKIDDAVWNGIKDKILTYAINYRLAHDGDFKKIVDGVRAKNKILIYYKTEKSENEWGAAIKADGSIAGQNKYGLIIMKLAGGFPV
jgi:hypothetical protein